MALKRTCSQYLKEALLKEYPGLKDNYGHWRHLFRLLFGQDHNKVVIGMFQIARDYRKLKEMNNHRFSAIEHILEFQEDVLRYEIIDYSPQRNRCRLAKVVFPSHIISLRDQELLYPMNPRYFISNGKIVNPRNQKALKAEDLEAAYYKTIIEYINPLVIKIQTYLNELPTNRFTKVLKHLPLARAAMWDMDDEGSYYVKPSSHYQQLCILSLIEEQPQPIYAPSSQFNTLRLFQVNTGLQGINSYLRGILTQDWIELDIQHAHLSIAAALWNITYLQNLLAAGVNIWDVLVKFINESPSQSESDELLRNEYAPYHVIKSKLKALLYSALYGMSITHFEMAVYKAFGPDKAKLLLNHPIITSIIQAREARYKLLSKSKEYTTPMGKVFKPFCYTDDSGFHSNLSTIMSYEISEFEMLLLEPIFDLSIETQQFFITLYQYDGVSIDIKDKSRTDSVIKRICSVFDTRAKELGIHTRLVVKV